MDSSVSIRKWVDENKTKSNRCCCKDELAKKVGTSAPIIGRYERNEIKPSIEMAKNIADALGVTLDYLLGDSNNAVLDKELLKRLEDIENLPDEDRNNIFYTLDNLIKAAKLKAI